ncbi:hypothetical protein DPMN_006613 [Dreissena polymorpha]|uniref:Uncharacterized protein n=1 Tax=Dreissena polymorpha TaxID=45954 RepID=A0A9D4MVS4_DREPO|nr:hypothetical protein DPMN_006613 [Dreissena polymorpha]
MSANTSRQDLCPICNEEIEISKNNWVAIQWKRIIEDKSQKRAIIETASRLIKSDIKSEVVTLPNRYLSTLSFLPTSLRTLLEALFYGKDTIEQDKPRFLDYDKRRHAGNAELEWKDAYFSSGEPAP